LPGGAFKKINDGAASNWASFRSATFLIFANLALLPVVNSAWVSAHAKDWIAIWTHHPLPG